jgi:hypothetical protein
MPVGRRTSIVSVNCDRRFENRVFRASGLNLLVAAIILWNSP